MRTMCPDEVSAFVSHIYIPTNRLLCVSLHHRSGRTARGGAKGRVTSLLQSRTDRNMAKAIQYALDKGIGLDQVTASGAAAVSDKGELMGLL